MSNKYTSTLTNKKLFERLFPITVPSFTFEKSDFDDKVLPDPKTKSVVPCKYVRLHKIVNSNRSYNEYLDLYITDYDIYQYANGAEMFTTEEVKLLLSNLFMDQSNYEEDWKTHHSQAEQKAFEELLKADYENGNFLAKGTTAYKALADAHKQRLEEIDKGLPPFNLSRKTKLPKILEEIFGNV